MAGANHIVDYGKNRALFPFYAPDVTSYGKRALPVCNHVFTLIWFTDYDAPLSENGGYTPKYEKAVEMIAAYDTLSGVISKPEKPEHIPAFSYPEVQIAEYLSFAKILENVVRKWERL